MHLKFLFLSGFLLAAGSPLRAAVATLDDAYRSALGRDEGVRQAEQSVLRADEHVGQLRGGILPSIALNAMHNIQQEPADPIARQFSPQQQTTINLSFTQPLF